MSGRATIAALAVAIVVLTLGLTLELVLAPPLTGLLVPVTSPPETVGLPADRVLDLAQQVRAYVSGTGGGTLPATVDGAPGFDGAQVAHLDDVAAVIAGGRVATLLALGSVVGLALAAGASRRSSVSSAMRAAGLAILASVPLAGLAGLADFDALFAGFHGLFFAEGTWVFPYDSLIIRLFPVDFWVRAGLAWGASVALAGVGLLLAGRHLAPPRRPNA